MSRRSGRIMIPSDKKLTNEHRDINAFWNIVREANKIVNCNDSGTLERYADNLR